MSDSTLLFEAEEVPRSQWRALWDRFRPLQWLANLKVRVALCSVAVLMCAMYVTTARMSDLAQQQLITQAEAREQVHARQLASVMMHRVARLQQALALGAASIESTDRQSPGRLVASLRDQRLLRAMFTSLALIDPDSRIETSIDDGGPATAAGRTVTDSAALRQALLGRPAVSGVTTDPRIGTPMVKLFQPLLEGSRVWGVLVGRLQLNGADLLPDLSEVVDNDDSSIVVITDGEGLILSHPQSAMHGMRLSFEARLAAASAQWLRIGRPLVQVSGAWNGRDDVVAMAGEPASGWHVWRVASIKQLLAPMENARRDAQLSGLALAAVLALLLVAVVAWQLQPLTQLERRANRLLRGDDSDSWPESGGEIGRLATTLRHVWAERTQADRFTADIMQKLMSVMGASPVGLAFVRHQKFELISAEGCRMLQRDEAELCGRPANLIFAEPMDFERLRQAAGMAFEAGLSYEGEWLLKAADCSTFWARIHSRPVRGGDVDAGSIWSLYNIEGHVAARQRLEHVASHDMLTGLLNRKAFVLRATEVHGAQATSHPASLVMLDLDRFKPVNDTGGHAAGDAMLKAIAAVMTKAVRGSDSVARMGGDEFALLLPNCSLDQAVLVAEKVRQAVQDVVLPWKGQTFQVGASLGVAGLLHHHTGVDEWMADADAACYAAKHAGRNSVQVAAAPPSAQQLEVDCLSNEG